MKKVILSFLLILASNSYAQTASGDMEAYLHDIISDMPGDTGNDYQEPSSSNLTTWETIITNILSNNVSAARTEASSLNYQIVEYTNTSLSDNKVFYILEEKSPQSNYWGTYIFAKTPERGNLVLLSPHSRHDTNTGKQGVHCLVRLNNRALFLNGTHRCNHSDSSSCSGTTTVCSATDTKEAFKISDMAHNTNSIYQKTTEIVFDNMANSVFFQFHGFSKKSTDPYVILSNGTQETPTTDYASLLQQALLNEDSTLTFKIAHIDTDWDRLRGFTNTQGRYINESSDPCSSSATTTTGRFLHIEQEKSKLREDSTGWNKMSNAIGEVFASSLSVEEQKPTIQLYSENPFTNSVVFSGKNISQFTIFNSLGKAILQRKNNQETITVNTVNFNRGLYILRVKKANGFAYKKLLRE